MDKQLEERARRVEQQAREQQQASRREGVSRATERGLSDRAYMARVSEEQRQQQQQAQVESLSPEDAELVKGLEWMTEEARQKELFIRREIRRVNREGEAREAQKKRDAEAKASQEQAAEAQRKADAKEAARLADLAQWQAHGGSEGEHAQVWEARWLAQVADKITQQQAQAQAQARAAWRNSY